MKSNGGAPRPDGPFFYANFFINGKPPRRSSHDSQPGFETVVFSGDVFFRCPRRPPHRFGSLVFFRERGFEEAGVNKSFF